MTPTFEAKPLTAEEELRQALFEQWRVLMSQFNSHIDNQIREAEERVRRETLCEVMDLFDKDEDGDLDFIKFQLRSLSVQTKG